jgi:DNA-binding winged helix-turn-helix (wHTH) protein
VKASLELGSRFRNEHPFRNDQQVQIGPISIFEHAGGRRGRWQSATSVRMPSVRGAAGSPCNPIKSHSRSIAMLPATVAPAAIEFGRFWVLPDRRARLADNRPLDLGARAFDLLMALIESRGVVVGRAALMQRVWPGRIVEENNPQAQVSALRKAFAADCDLIRTVAGRGYQFTGEIRTASASRNAEPTTGTPEAAPVPARPTTNLPEPVSELMGRDAELTEILDLSASHRLVTLTGAGGIGKTRLGFEVARHRLSSFPDGVWAAELAPLSDPDLVPVTVAAALGLELASGTASPQSVANALRSKQLMIVLGNCEHVVDAAARVADALLHVNPAICVIATSREPLRAEGEWVYRVPPLAVPSEGSLDSDDPLRYGAVGLFVERTRAAAPDFAFDPSSAATRRNLPPPRRHPVGNRACGGACGDVGHRDARRPPRRLLRSADRQEADGPAAAANPAGYARLEP